MVFFEEAHVLLNPHRVVQSNGVEAQYSLAVAVWTFDAQPLFVLISFEQFKHRSLLLPKFKAISSFCISLNTVSKYTKESIG